MSGVINKEAQIYSKFMSLNPTKLMTLTNQRGQRVNIYEDPTGGDSRPVLAAFPEHGVVRRTGFFDTEDFYADSDYNPVITDEGDVVCAFELM